jgi:hypothetical protein
MWKMFKFLKIKFTMHDGNKVRTNNKHADIYASSVSSRKPQNGIVGMEHTQVKNVSTFSTLRRCWLVPQKLMAWDFLQSSPPFLLSVCILIFNEISLIFQLVSLCLFNMFVAIYSYNLMVTTARMRRPYTVIHVDKMS